MGWAPDWILHRKARARHSLKGARCSGDSPCKTYPPAFLNFGTSGLRDLHGSCVYPGHILRHSPHGRAEGGAAKSKALSTTPQARDTEGQDDRPRAGCALCPAQIEVPEGRACPPHLDQGLKTQPCLHSSDRAAMCLSSARGLLRTWPCVFPQNWGYRGTTQPSDSSVL